MTSSAALFPPEIIERILIQCDGKTLLNCRFVCKQWSELIQYLTNKLPFWRWCCQNEIPKREIVQYSENYHCRTDLDKIWFHIYLNWLTWQNIPSIRFDIVLSRPDIPRITCIDVFENYIAVGSEDGRVRIFNDNWKPLCLTRHLSEKVGKVTFLYTMMNNDDDDEQMLLKIVIAYPKALIIDDVFGGSGAHVTIESTLGYRHSVYKDCICYQKTAGIMVIERLVKPNDGKFLKELWFRRIYCPNNIIEIKMWDGLCVMLHKNDVRILDYSQKGYYPKLYPDSDTPDLYLSGFSSPPNSMPSQQIVYVLRDDVIIILHSAENNGDTDKKFMEVIIIMGTSNCARKLFCTSELFEATITCVYLYGNTFVLGLDNGIVYFYHVASWKHFSIKDYQKKIIIGKHPITNIVAQETKDKRKFFITSSFNIHEVVGYCNSSFFP